MEQTGFTAATGPSEHSVGTASVDGVGTSMARPHDPCEPQGSGRPMVAPTESGEQTREKTEPSGDGLQESAFSLPVKFNKQDYHLSLEEATVYAQKGMKFDTVEPMLEKLKVLAQQHGLGVRELVDTLCEGDIPTVSNEERLAEEFGRLREECPDVTAFDAVPESVIRTALEEGIPLLDAYLRYEHRERVRVKAAAEAARKAGAASAGAQRSELQPTPDPAVAAMLEGVRG